jgi:hypothetical protein
MIERDGTGGDSGAEPSGRGWHLGPELIERFVLGMLDGPGEARLSAHVRCCPPCAAALAAEARRELALQAIVPRVARRSPRRERGGERIRPTGGSPLLAFGAAAVALLVALAGDQAGIAGLLGGRAAIGEREMLASAAPGSMMVCLADTDGPLCPWTDLADGAQPARASLALPPAAAGTGGFCAPLTPTCRR